MTRFNTRTLLPAACVAALLAPTSAHAASFVWDGTTDQNWTNGPQDETNNPGSFPANGSVGANWTIDGGSAGQIATPATGPGGNMIDYGFNGHDWTINNAVINEDVQIKLDGGSLNITNSTVSLLPSSANTTANLSGLNLGQDLNPTPTVLTNSTLNINRSNQVGNALRVRNGSSMELIGSTVNVDTELGTGGVFIVEGAGSSLTIDATSIITTTGDLRANDNTSITLNGGTLNLSSLRLNSGPNPTEEDPVTEYSGLFAFNSGTITLSDPNPLRDSSAFEGAFNWLAPAGDGSSITHTDLSANDTNLTGKTTQGYFAIDGVRINPTLDNTTDWTDPANIDALNAELLALAVNGKYFEITQDTLAGTQVMTLLQLALIPGDTDGDGDVDDTDLGIAISNFTGPGGTGKTLAEGDTDGDGDVDDTDLGVMISGFTGPLTPAAVPEPTSLALLGLGGLLAVRRRRA